MCAYYYTILDPGSVTGILITKKKRRHFIKIGAFSLHFFYKMTSFYKNWRGESGLATRD